MSTHPSRPAAGSWVNAAAELAAVALIVAFWILVYWPGILPTVALALLAWSRNDARARARRRK